MYEKEIRELRKKIDNNNKEIKLNNSRINLRLGLIIAALVGLTGLGVGIGSLFNHPIYGGIFGFSASFYASGAIYEGVKYLQNRINSLKMFNAEHENTINLYKKEAEKSKQPKITESDKKTYSYSKDRKNPVVNEADFDQLIDVFRRPEDNKNKSR